MVGVTRIHIVDDRWNDAQVRMSKGPLSHTADGVLRQAFSSLGMSLLPGREEIKCTREEVQGRYDWREGIDVILSFESGNRATVQEKYLTWHENTITFEEQKASRKPGAWYYCTAQYYLVAYARKWKRYRVPFFQSWILIDYPAIVRASAQGIEWRRTRPTWRGTTFRYLYFWEVPKECVIAQYVEPKKPDPLWPERTS